MLEGENMLPEGYLIGAFDFGCEIVNCFSVSLETEDVWPAAPEFWILAGFVPVLK